MCRDKLLSVGVSTVSHAIELSNSWSNIVIIILVCFGCFVNLQIADTSQFVTWFMTNIRTKKIVLRHQQNRTEIYPLDTTLVVPVVPSDRRWCSLLVVRFESFEYVVAFFAGFQIIAVFATRCYASAAYAVMRCLSVCPSVRPSRSWILS